MHWASLVAQIVKNLPPIWEVQPLGWEDTLEEGMATHSSILAWRIRMDRGAWWATDHGVEKSQTQLINPHHICPTSHSQPEEGLVLHPNGFPGVFLKEQKGVCRWRCLKVKVTMDTLFPFVNSIFILHPNHLRFYTWNPTNRGFLFLPPCG